MCRQIGQTYKKEEELKTVICISIEPFLLEYIDNLGAKNRSVAICDIIKNYMEVGR